MKPLDPRLLKHARGSASYIGLLVALGAVTAGLVITQAQLLATAIAGAFTGGDTLSVLRGVVIALAVVLAGRALVAWAAEAVSYRASAMVKAQLREKVLARAVVLGPRWLAGQRSGELTALATGGLDALDGYFAKYLPQLILSVIVPVAVLTRVFWSDWLSGVIIAATLPLIPVFGALVGKATGDYAQRRWETLARLSHHFLDVVTGLPTLKVFGRARAQRDTIGRVTDDYRRATMDTLRVAFLSALVLELVATISVALVAVAIGLRLVGGHLSLQTGLMVLILAPEAYLPLRQAGAQFHASADGLAAAEQAFAVIEEPMPAGDLPPSSIPESIRIAGLSVDHPGREAPAPDGVSLEIRRGEITAVAGPSGSGKSTLLSVLLGFTRPSRGTVTVTGQSHVAWVPQDPALFAGTVESNIRLGWPSASAEAVSAAARAAALTDVRLDRAIGEGGAGLSAGQRRRVALARALLPPRSERPVLLLDEPSAGLDADTEARVLDTLRSEALAGRAILIAAHHPAVLAVADRIVSLTAPPVAATVDDHSIAVAERGPAAAPARRPRPADGGPGSQERTPEGPDRTRRRLTVAALLGALASLCAVGLLAISAWLISRAAQHPPVLYLLVAVTSVRAFGIGRAVFRYGERLAGHDAALRILARLRVSAWDQLERLAPAGLAAFRSGDLLSRLVRDVDSLADRWLRVRLPYLVAAVAGGAAVAVSAALAPKAGLILAASLITASVVAPLVALGVARRSEQQIAPRRGELATAALDLLRGAGELSVFGAAGRALGQVTDAGQAVARSEARSAYARGISAAVALLAGGTAIWAAVVIGVPAVRAHTLAGVTLAVVVLVPLAAHELFASLAPAAQEIPRLRAAATRVSAMMTQPDPVAEPSAPAAAPAPPYDLRIRNLTARWDAGGPDVLHGFDLHVRAGQRVAVTGPSGSGKTTLAMVLLRFLDPAAGTVTLGGTDIAALDSGTVRRIIGLCAQDAHIFDSTLEANLRLARPDATERDLRHALARARLLDWVDSLPAGLATPVGEHGAQLSGGQRQRLALARVLLADFPVVILDEPAEHLDEATADQLTRDLLEATAGRTVLLITHRPVDLAEVDQVVQLKARGMPAGQRTVRPGPLALEPRMASAVS